MEILKEFITSNLTTHPELSEYSDVVLDFVSTHQTKRPDMSIEGCKSLIEGIAKLVFLNLGSGASPNDWGSKNLQQKFCECKEALRLSGYEEEFLQKNSDLVLKLGQIRNERGDVSHGQAYPKNSYSDQDFAKFISLWVEGLCYFILSRYIATKKRGMDSEGVYSEDQFKEFDDYLDGLYPEISHISYSKALRDQDGLQYELMMDDYMNKYA